MDDPASSSKRVTSRYKNEWPSVRHYYGDVVRVLFIVIAVLLGISVLLSDNVPLGLIISTPAIILLVMLAGYMNPHGRIVFIVSMLTAAFGVLVIEIFAAAAYTQSNMPLAASLGIAWLMCIIALYYSVKNLRASQMHQIGKIDGVGEFNEPADR